VQAHPFVDREGRIPPGLVAGLIVFVLVIGALAYSAGRFGRRGPAVSPPDTLPPPAAPMPAVAQKQPTPADFPPTVTPSLPEVVGRVLVQKSLQIIVPVAPLATTPRPGAFPFTPTPDDTPAPLPSPTVPELEEEQGNEEEPEEMPQEPEPEPTPGSRGQAGGSPVSM
jgi:hypothetical protein